MSKTYVTNEAEGSRIPFLRGILTRSLHSAGVDFDTAFSVATTIRDQLGDVPELNSDELKARVLKLLKDFPNDVVEHYGAPVVSPRTVMVVDEGGDRTAFSRQRHQRTLEAAGLSAKDADSVTHLVYEHLLQARVKTVPTCQLDYLTYDTLMSELGKKAAKRYLVWSEFFHSGRPLLLLIGGTNGCGKSTIATEVAHRLDIVRIQSTDMLREVMRQMMPENLLPVLHQSSFLAWKALPYIGEEPDVERLLEDGFRSQAELLNVPCEAVLSRARRERVSMVVEGIHVLPGLPERLATVKDDAIVVCVMLAALKPRELKKRLRGRGSHTPHRRAERYLAHFDSIWQLQSMILSDADLHDIPIVNNEKKGQVIQEVMTSINQVLATQFHGTPEQVFGARKTASNDK